VSRDLFPCITLRTAGDDAQEALQLGAAWRMFFRFPTMKPSYRHPSIVTLRFLLLNWEAKQDYSGNDSISTGIVFILKDFANSIERFQPVKLPEDCR